MQTTKALLIDDEEYSRLHLRGLLSAAHPDVQIVGEAAALQPARSLITQGGYDLLFLDVKLGPDDAFDLVPEIPPDKPIIFVTGYDQHARRAFEVNAVDYLLKPVRAARLTESLERARERKRLSPPAAVSVPAAVTPAQPTLSLTDSLSLQFNGATRLIRVAEIALIVAQENYSAVHLADGSQTFIRRSLKSWLALLPAADFSRVHRNRLVNLTQIVSYHHATPRQIALRVVGVDGPVRVSRFASASLKARLRERFPH